MLVRIGIFARRPVHLQTVYNKEEVRMSDEGAIGCARPTGGPVGEEGQQENVSAKETNQEEQVMIKVGQKAPDFTAPGYHKGEFVQVKLSDYLSKWVLLCFYPGDFTFV